MENEKTGFLSSDTFTDDDSYRPQSKTPQRKKFQYADDYSPVNNAPTTIDIISTNATGSFVVSQLLLGDTVPNFTQKSTKGSINFHEYIGGSWSILFSHPKDFTPVCTTELIEVAKLASEWNKRNTKVIALSIDSVESHKNWITDLVNYGNVSITYPIIADEDYTVSNLFSMIHPNESDQFTVRSVFFIDPNYKLRAHITYPAAVGRNFNEIVRVLDALQLADSKGIATPANWKVGDRVIIPPSLSDEEARQKFGAFVKAKPYLRFTDLDQP